MADEVEQKAPEVFVDRGQLIKKNDRPLAVSKDTAFVNLPTNLDLKSPEGKALAFNALGQGDFEVSPKEPVTILATNWLIYPGEVPDKETGEMSDVNWLVLFAKDGTFIKTTSDIAASRIQDGMRMWKSEDWKEGIPLKVSVRYNKKTDRHYHDVRVDMSFYR